MNNNKKGNSALIIILLMIVLVVVFCFPVINKFVVKVSNPKIHSNNKSKMEEKKFNADIIEDIHFPNMRNSIYSDYTYYSLDKFSISNMKNSEILLNAFLDIYEGNITSLGTPAKCGGTSATFEQKYIELRIKNILGRNLKYNLEDFEVPSGSNSKFVGKWRYDSANKKFIYEGECNKISNSIKYYDLKQLKEGKYEGSDLVLYYYVGFAKIEGNRYTLYSKPDMKEIIANGEFVDLDSLQNIFDATSSNKKKIYKYVFKNSICTYNEYCLYEGSWD